MIPFSLMGLKGLEPMNEKVKDSNISVSEAGRRGGQATLQNHGIKHFKKIGHKGGKRTVKLYKQLLSEFGKRGGRPHRPMLDDYMEEEDR
jgi:general stress protein YciG